MAEQTNLLEMKFPADFKVSRTRKGSVNKIQKLAKRHLDINMTLSLGGNTVGECVGAIFSDEYIQFLNPTRSQVQKENTGASQASLEEAWADTFEGNFEKVNGVYQVIRKFDKPTTIFTEASVSAMQAQIDEYEEKMAALKARIEARK